MLPLARPRHLLVPLLLGLTRACSGAESDDPGSPAVQAVELPDGFCAGVSPEVVDYWDLRVDEEETTSVPGSSTARCAMSGPADGAADGGTVDLLVELRTVGGADLTEQQATMDDLVAEQCDALEAEQGSAVEEAPVGGGCSFSTVTQTRDAAEVVQVTPTGLQLGGVVRITMTRDGNQAQLLLPQVSTLEAHFVLSEPEDLLEPEG